MSTRISLFVRIEEEHLVDGKRKRKRRIMPLSRMVGETKLGRPLSPDETIHHKNGDPLDNRPENIMILPEDEHTPIHRLADRFMRGKIFPLDELRNLVLESAGLASIPTPEINLVPGEYATIQPPA